LRIGSSHYCAAAECRREALAIRKEIKRVVDLRGGGWRTLSLTEQIFSLIDQLIDDEAASIEAALKAG